MNELISWLAIRIGRGAAQSRDNPRDIIVPRDLLAAFITTWHVTQHKFDFSRGFWLPLLFCFLIFFCVFFVFIGRRYSVDWNGDNFLGRVKSLQKAFSSL